MPEVISYGQYQKLSDADKALYTTNWNADGKSGTATLKTAKKTEQPKTTIPTQEMSDASKSTSKTVLSKKEAEGSGINWHSLPTEAAVKKGIASDSNGYIDASGNVHLNSALTEKRSEAAKKDLETGADYRTSKAPSKYELDLRNRTLGGKNTDGSYTYSNDELQNIISKYGASDPALKKAAEDELAKRKKSTSGTVKTGSNLGGKSTDRWVQWMVGQGYSREEIEAAYAKEGYSKDGKLFKAAMDKYYKEKPETKSDGISTDEPSDGRAFKSGEDVDKKTEEPPTNPSEIKQFSKDLNKFVIQAYLNGDFGKKSDPNAIASMGFYLLDKIGAALVNASQVARGLTPTAKSQWSQILAKETDLFGKKITAEWWKTLDPETKAALLRTGGVGGTSAKNVYENTDDTAVENAKKMDILEVSKLEQDQKTVAQSNLNALLQRKTELQTLINKLESDQGWNSYVEAMNAVVGTARGLESIGAASTSSTQSNNGFANTLSGSVGTGGIPAAFVSANISDSATWNNSSASSSGSSSSLNKDAFALAKYGSGEAYAKAGKEAQVKANKNLISELQNQIKIIDACINAWGKDLGVTSAAE